MLGKLIKHDFKATYKMQCGLYMVLLLLSVIAMISRFFYEGHPDNAALIILNPVTIAMAVIARVAIVIVTIIMAVLRYRKNILKDEGYLMHTLPVKKWELLCSKLIVPYVWTILNAVLIYLSIALEMRDLGFIDWSIFSSDVTGITTGNIVLFVIVMAFGLLLSFSMFYLCLNAGYAVSKDKDLMSFVAYIALYLINQAINAVGMFTVMAVDFGGISAIINTDTFPAEYFGHVLWLELAVIVVMSIVYNGISVYLLNRKLNLE